MSAFRALREFEQLFGFFSGSSRLYFFSRSALSLLGLRFFAVEFAPWCNNII